MRTELILYKPNVLKNWNFNSSNGYTADDGITIVNYWNLNGLWSLTSGQAICVNSDGSLLEQSGLTPNTTYKITISVDSISGTALVLNVGPTLAAFIITPGISELIINTGIYDSISFAMSIGDDVTLNWVTLIEDPSTYTIDQIDDISVPVTYSIADVRDISKRNASFTKTVDIPGTTNNDKIFNHIFEIDGDCNFNPNKRIKAILYYDGEEQLNGYLQLKKINRNQNGLSNYNLVSYQVVIIGGVTDIFKDMGETLVSELGYDEYTHTYNATVQELSWNAGITKNGVYTPNWINGFSQTATDVAIDSDGRVIVNFAAPHGFVANDQVYVNFSDATAIGYNGDQRVFEVLSSTSIKLYYPYIVNTSTLAGANFVFKHEPTGDGYVYPMIFQGLHADNTAHNGINWYIRDLNPAVYLKTYLDKIQNAFGYTFISNLFDSVNFKRLIMNAAIKDFKQSYAQLNHNAFQAGLSTSINSIIPVANAGTYSLGPPPTYLYRHAGSVVPWSYNQYPVFDDDFTLPNFDNSNTYSTITGYWSPAVTADYKLLTNISVKYDFTLPSGHTINTSVTAAAPIKITIQIIDFTSTAVLGTNFVTVDPVVQGNTFSVSCSLQTSQFQGVIGHNYGVEVNILYDFLPVQTAVLPPQPFDINIEIEADSIYFNEPIATSYAENATVDLVSAIPKMTCKDFLIMLIKMFNLYIESDKQNSKILYIEPRNDYYASGNLLDWTDKLDLNETIELQPMAELNAKIYEYKFKEDEAVLNKEHKAGAGYGYGDKIKKIDNDFLTSTNTTELPTSSGVLIDIPVNSDKIITGIYGADGSSLSRIDGNPRILYFGLAYTANPWNHLSQTGGTSFTNRILYPYAGHLDKVRGPKFDFNYSYPAEIYFTSDQWTSANLYNLYYSDMINELVSRNNKLITANLYLKASDISKLSFRDTYIIDGHHLRLNKITDYVPGAVKSVKCEFTKIEILNSFTNTHMRYSGQTFATNSLDGESLPTVRSMYTSNSLLNRTIRDYGDSNSITLTNSSNILVKGNNNSIGPNANNISIIDR